MALSAPWYAVGTFWAGFGLIVTIVVGIVTLWVMWRAALPRRKLVYEITSVRMASTEVEGKLELPDDTKPHNLYVVTLRLSNRGRMDIPSSDFDQGAPIRFDIASRIFSVAAVVSTPATAPIPPVTVVGGSLLVGPGLILRGQQIEITLFVEGPYRSLTSVQTPLIDVLVRLQDPAKPSLAEQAEIVNEALNKARQLFEDLEAEVQARSAIVEHLATEARQAEVRAEEASNRAALNEQEAKAVDQWLDRALQQRLGNLESRARRREWLLATIVASIIGLAVGIGAILIAHFLLGF